LTTIESNEKQISVKSEKSSDRARAGILFSFGALLFLLLTTASEAIYPHFNLQTNAISDLAAVGTKTTVIEETAIFGLGICWSLGAYYLFRNTGKRGSLALNILPGIGFIIAGVSPENVNVIIHSVGTFAFPLGAIVVILSYRMIDSPLKYFSLALGTSSLIATFLIFVGYRVICGTCGYQQGMSDLALGLGGLESLIIYPLLIWLIGFGGYLLTARRGLQ
jgi:hypothetical membrane protein